MLRIVNEDKSVNPLEDMVIKLYINLVASKYIIITKMTKLSSFFFSVKVV